MLTSYGRFIGDAVLPTLNADGDAEGSAKALFGTLETAEWLQVGGDFRTAWLRTKTAGTPLSGRVIWMQADLEAAIDIKGFVASGSLGYAHTGALGAAITRGVDQNAVSRQHWIGYRFDSAGLLLRAGRMNLPFGIRTIEHNLWARALTRTTINDDQQYGVALAYSSESVRAELMGIAGNWQLRPDDYRERGFSSLAEWSPRSDLAIGASALITHRQLDTVNLKETWRHTYGAFGRWATGWQPLVLQTESDYVFVSSKDEYTRRGLASFLQADIEPWQGVHFLATAEVNKVGSGKRFWGYGGWLSYWWFVAPHADLRVDGIMQSMGSLGGRYDVFTLLLQGHVYL